MVVGGCAQDLDAELSHDRTEVMATHPHSSGNKAGSYPDSVERPDVQFGGIGKHFPPMVHTAPVNGMSTPHFVTSCPSCSAAILWSHHGGNGTCAGCGIGLATHPDNGHPIVA